jgi:hypothetical protein
LHHCTKEEISAKSAEYGKDLDISNDAFDEALAEYLKRTGQTEETIGEILAQTDALTG